MKEMALVKEYNKVKQTFPDKTEPEVFRVLQKRVINANVPGSPSYHYHHLQDLLQRSNDWRLPHILLTLTADELSNLRWTSINDMEAFVSRHMAGQLWQDLPAECGHLFRDRMEHFLKEHLLRSDGQGVLGRVQHHFTRYEVQMRGSLHVHILLWLHPDDVDKTTSEIMASLPCKYTLDDNGYWAPCHPTAEEQTTTPAGKLYQYVQRKQMHKVCNTWGPNTGRPKPT